MSEFRTLCMWFSSIPLLRVEALGRCRFVIIMRWEHTSRVSRGNESFTGSLWGVWYAELRVLCMLWFFIKLY